MNKLGKYEIIEELGRGAMGVVYKARDPLIGRMVALKTITSGLAEQPEMLERFYREAQAAGGLAHPNIVTIFDLGEEQKTPYIAMEFLEGISIEKIIEENHPLPMSQKVGYIVQVCRALDYAHKRGVVHRDIKPANIVVIKDGTIKVVDFGIARLVDTSRSQTGLLIGTVNYMSPEQVRGERVDGRSDIFSVGVMFYELLSGQRPFVGANFTAVMLAIISQEPKPISSLMEGIPPDLDAVFTKFFKKDANDRYQAMEEALLDLEPIHRKMQTESVAEIVKQAENLVAGKKMEEARDVLRQALQIDSTNRSAKTLLEKVNAELKRSLVMPKADEHLGKAKQFLEQGKVAEAQAEVDAALKLDSVYEPAQDLLKQVQKEADKAKKARDFLRAAQQQMAEGNLTEAQQQVDKLLEMDSKNAEAKKLLKQITEEKERRAKRQRLQDTMQRARGLWTEQKYEECIKLLEGLKKEFPGEDEIDKLLETVRSDEEEQTKHEKLTEARRLLGEQHFAESLAILDKLLERNPNETTIQKLREMVVKERKDHAQRVRLQHEQQALKKLVNEENYKEAITKGEQLLKEFPDDFELTRLVEFARTQQTQIEQQRKLKEKLEELNRLMQGGDYARAIPAAEKALEAFPDNLDFTRILESARNKQKEQEKKDYVEKQIRGIKAAIDKGNLTDAIDLGRQTLSVVKSDTDVTRLMQFAEREKEMRGKKIETDQQLKTAIFLMESKKFDEATEVLENVKKTVVFDPRVHSLLEAAKAKELPKADRMAEIQQTIVGMVGPSKEQEYVLQTPGGKAGAPVDETVVAKAQIPGMEPTPSPKAPPVPVTPPPEKKAAPAPEPAPPPKPAVEPPPPPKKPEAKPVEAPPEKKKDKGKPAVEEPPEKEPVKAKPAPAVEPPPPPKPPAPPVKPAVEPPPPAKAKPVEAPPKPAPPPPEKKAAPAPSPVAPPKPAVEPPPRPKPAVEAPSVAVPPIEEKKSFIASPAGMGVIGVVVLAIGIGVYVAVKPKPAAGPGAGTEGGGGTGGGTGAVVDPTAAQQEALLSSAKDLAAKGDIVGAKAKVEEGLKLNGPHNAALLTLKAQLANAEKNATQLAQEKQFFDQGVQFYTQNDFDKAAAAFKKVLAVKDGLRRADASRYVNELIPSRKQEEKNMTDAKRLANSSNPADLQNAKGMLDTVVKLNGPRKSEAETLLKTVDEKLAALGKEAQIQGAMTAGRDALGRNDFNAARASVENIKQLGGDPTALQNEISRVEQSRVSQFMTQFNALKVKKDVSGLQALMGDAKRFADASGNSTARNLADNEIPGAIKTIEKENADALAGQQKSEFDAAVAAFGNAKDKAALDRVRPQFERIASGGGPYAGQAQDYISNKIPARIAEVSVKPCKAIVVPASAGGALTQTPKEGATVAASLLDDKPTWTSCTLPAFPGNGVARLTLVVDEEGNIAEVKPRGAQPNQQLFEAVAAAAKSWKVTPPRSKGIRVRTEISYDVSY